MQDFETIWPSLQGYLGSLEERRLALWKRVKRVRIAALLLSPLWVALYWFVYQFSGDFIFPTVLSIFSLLFFFYYFSWRYQQPFLADFKLEIIQSIVQGAGYVLDYEPRSYIAQEDYERSKLYTEPINSYQGEDLIRGRVGKTELRFSELRAVYERSGKSDSTVTAFQGVFFIADANKHFSSETYILATGALQRLKSVFADSQAAGRGEFIEMENPEFNRAFRVYASDSIEARYLLTPDFMERFLALRSLGREVSASFVAGHLHIGIETAQDFFQADLGSSLLEKESLRPFYEELKSFLDIVEVLNLNTRIWSKL